MIKYTEEHRTKLEAWLQSHDLPAGLGSKKSACTVAAINLAISGELTDNIPDCMSNVLGHTAIRLQDAMPVTMRNSDRYKTLIPNMPGTGRDHEANRLEILIDWMWTAVLPQVQHIADKHGFGADWQEMCQEKTSAAARAAADAAAARAAAARADADAYTAAYAAARAAAYAAYDAAAYDAYDAAANARAAADAAAAAYAAYDAAAYDAYTAAYAAAADAAAAYAAACNNFWAVVDPIGVLERMTYLEEPK